MQEIQSFLFVSDSVYFNFIKRSGNSLAHLLAKDITSDCDGDSTLPDLNFL